MKLIVLNGKPGVGKLTVGRELEALTGYRLCHNHLTVDLLSSVFDFGTASFSKLREKIWLDIFSEAASSNLPGVIFTFAFEPTVSPEFIGNLKTAVESRGGEVIFVKLTCADDELEKRVVSPSRLNFGKLSSLELFQELEAAGTFSDPGLMTNHLVLDTTGISPVDAAGRIATELALPRV
jgi:AAA domain